MKKKNIFLVIGIIPILIGAAFILMISLDTTSSAEMDSQQSAEKEPIPSNEEEKKEVPPSEPEEPESFTIAFAGDTMFDWGLRPVLEEKGYDYPFEYVKKDLMRADYTMVNLETAITERTQKTDGQLYWIKSEEKSLPVLKDIGIDMVNLANNHTLDYGKEGLVDTIESVESNGFEFIGAGRNEQEAYQAKVVSINNKRVAFLSFDRFFPDSDWASIGEEPGVTNGYNLDFVISKIKEEQKEANADYLVVNFHWGVEKTNSPAPYQREYVKRIVEETETDAIIGSHPHWLQGFEFYQGVPVAYSLGNFLFPDYVSGHAAETGVYNLTFSNGEVTADFVPYVIEDNQIKPLTGDKEQAMYRYLDDISINASLNEEGQIIKE